MAKVKGTILVPLVKALRARKEEARALLAPELQHYLVDRVLVTGWYDEQDHLDLLRVLGLLMGVADYRPMGHALAHFELEGVYKAALHVGDAMRTVHGFTRFWPFNHDTGRVDITERPGGATLTLTGYALVAREICDIVTGFAEEAMRMSVGRSGEVVHTRCRSTGAPICVWEIELPL
jgi:hypothetical protein